MVLRAIIAVALLGLVQIGSGFSPASADTNEDPAGSAGFSSLSAGEQHTCAILANGRVKCWGRGASGQLGLNTNFDRGDGPNEMANSLPYVNLGAGRTATALALGLQHTCALLDNGSVKCWGNNAFGQLGQGNTANKGASPGDMDALAAVNLGTGRTAVAITAGQYHTCALLDTGDVKCWGQNMYGQLGLGDTANRGDGAGEMGNALVHVDVGDLLGVDFDVESISAGLHHTCALLTTGSLKCWGRNDSAQLGLEDTANRGDGAGEMGNALDPVDLGLLAIPTAVSAGRLHTCVILLGGAVKCWGLNDQGQLGLGDTDTRGNAPGEMGNDLDEVDLGAGNDAVAISAGFHTCALLDDGDVKCWGHNADGELGQGDVEHRGDGADEMGGDLDAVDLGTGRTADVLTTGLHHTCAVLDDGSYTCWGANGAGRLGLGHTNNRGDGPGEMGDQLQLVEPFRPPENDDRADAEPITDDPDAHRQVGSTGGPTFGADKEAGEPAHAGNAGGASVWYRFTAARPGEAQFDTSGSSYNTLLAAYTYAGNDPTEVAASDDASGLGQQSSITFDLAAGQEYWIAVDGKSGATGALTLNYRLSSPRPDVQIRTGATGPIFGRNGYGPPVETVPSSAVRGGQMTFTVIVENDADFEDQFTIKIPAGTARFTARYLNRPNNANITPRVVAGTFTTPVLAPGAQKTIRIVVRVSATAPPRTSLTRNVRVASVTDVTVHDNVRYTAKRR